MKAIAFTAIGVLALALTSCKKDVKNGADLRSTESRDIAGLGKGAGGTQTAQSVMIGYNGPTEVIIVNDQVWHFNPEAAAMASPDWNNCASATSGRNNGNSCRNSLINAAMQSRCAFWNQEGHPFWVLKQQTQQGDANALIDFTVTLAGESYMKGGGFKNGKYSFTLGTDSTSRISNLVYSVDGGTPVPLAHTIVQGTPQDNLAGFQYTSTGQKFGNPAVFSALIDGTMADVLAADGTTNNDGANLWAFTAYGRSAQVSLALAPGIHNITVSANIKENEGVATWTVTKTAQVNISAQGCQ